MMSLMSALRRRLMIDTGPGFVFEYTGDFTDNRNADGTGKVRFTSSGTLMVIKGTATVKVYIRGSGGGAASARYTFASAGTTKKSCAYGTGGGGGYQTISDILLEEGQSYTFTIGAAGTGKNVSRSGTEVSGTAGGNVVAFGYTSKGGGGATAEVYATSGTKTAGTGGTPNGKSGTTGSVFGTTGSYPSGSGGSPNGGAVSSGTAQSGGKGYVEITFS